MIHRLAILLGGATLGFVGLLAVAPANADPVDFFELGNNAFHTYRPPWRERLAWERSTGCPVNANGMAGCGAHIGIDNYALDLNKRPHPDGDCGTPLRADGSGETRFFSEFETGGYGYLLGILHAKVGGTTSSWYAHLTSGSGPTSANYAQGDHAGWSSDTGNVTGCHLHFQVNTGSSRPGTSGYQTVNVCMAALTCPGVGFDLAHLSAQPTTEHPSNNTGAGYGRPGAPANLDPGPETTALSWQINNLVRWFISLGSDTGSTLASTQGQCAANRHWVKSCFFGYGGTGYTQNFLSRDYLGLFFPKSVMEGTFNLGVPVTNAVWKAYGRKCFGAGGGAVTHILLARPLWIEQGTGPTTTRQDFQYGFITRDNADPNAVIVNVYLYQPIPLAPILLCTFPNLVDYHIGQCWDSNRDGSVDIADWLEELNHYGDETSGVYDDVYDHNRNGFVGEADVQAVADHFGQVCK